MAQKSRHCKKKQEKRKNHNYPYTNQKRYQNHTWSGGVSSIQAHLDLGLQHRRPGTGKNRAVVSGGVTWDPGGACGKKDMGEWYLFTKLNGELQISSDENSDVCCDFFRGIITEYSGFIVIYNGYYNSG